MENRKRRNLNRTNIKSLSEERSAFQKLILRAFAAADEFKSAGSLASSVRFKTQAKLIADPEGTGKGAGLQPCASASRDQQEAGLATRYYPL